MRDSGPVCAACGQPVDPAGFVCLGCGSALQTPGSPPLPPGVASAPPVGATAAPAAPPAAPSALPPPAWDVRTLGHTDSATVRTPLPPLPPLPPAPAAASPSLAAEPPADDPSDAEDRTVVIARRPRAEWALRLASGERVPVDGVLLLGRRPDPAAAPAGARTVAIDDPARTVSRTHLVVEPRPGDGLLLRDLSSANGIVLLGADGSSAEIEPGGEARVAEACTLVLGAVEIGVEPC